MLTYLAVGAVGPCRRSVRGSCRVITSPPAPRTAPLAASTIHQNDVSGRRVAASAAAADRSPT